MPNDPAPADAIPSAVPAKPAGRRPGERRLQILQTLAEMLEHPKAERVTTAALAKKLDVSEAALYRHFASKAQMFEGLIEFIEQTVFGLVTQITRSEESGVKQARQIIGMLLEFAQTNRGMTRVLIGDALVIEDERLQDRMNQLMDRLEASLKQSLKVAVAQGSYPDDEDPAVRASLIMAFVMGRWSRFAKSGFRKSPLEYGEAQARLLLS
jgi:TetR/AcrR family transcriptional regulator